MESVHDSKRLYDTDQAAQTLNISKWTVVAHLKKNNLRSIKIGRRRLIPAEEIARVVMAGLPSLSAK
jgi:excisionase family DNA binding protein